LAAGLTSIYPLLSAFLTPLACVLALKTVPDAGSIQFNLLGVLLTLVATITLPLALGIYVNHQWPTLGRRLLRPVEIVSEGIGALSLTVVTVVEFRSILETGWLPLLAMLLVAELSLVLGYILGCHPEFRRNTGDLRRRRERIDAHFARARACGLVAIRSQARLAIHRHSTVR
jgi:predicted Na+-dependent transporter